MAWNEKYVTNAGAGTQDGLSLANAWSWATMLTTLAAGDSANISGAITRTTSADVFTNNGTTAVPIRIRGMNATTGDLEANGRTRGGALITTNFPVITYTTAGLTFPNFCIVECLSLTSARTTWTSRLGSSNVMRRCVVTNTHASTNGNLAIDAFTNPHCIIDDCDFDTSTSSATPHAVSISQGTISRCLITASGGAGCISAGSRSFILNNMIRSAGKGITVATTSNIYAVIEGNSFRAITGNYIDNQATTGSSMICNNVAWGSGGSSRWYNSTTSVRAMFQQNNALGNFGSADVNEGDWPVYSEVALSVDPFTSATDLTLNSTSGGGAACVGAGLHAYLDLGAWQNQASSGSSGEPSYAFIG